MLQKKQESILVECIPPACQPYLFWWPLGVGTSRGIGIREIPTPLGYLLPTGIPAFPGYLPSLITYPWDIKPLPEGTWDQRYLPLPVDRHTPVETLPSRNYHCGR